jgi:hypothetical protein
MTQDNNHLDRIAWGVLLVAWFGVWGAWFPHSMAALRLNPIDLAEWTTFLRSGKLHLMPDLLRLAVVLAMIALSVSAGAIRNQWLRWGSRLLAIIPSLLILPPYPFVLQAWWSDSYGLRFTVAALGIAGTAAALLLDRRVEQRRIISAVLALVAAVLAVWVFVTLRVPFGQRYDVAIAPGWGFVIFVISLVVVIGAAVMGVVRSKSAQILALVSEAEE